MQFQDLSRLVVDRPDAGEFLVHRDIYRDPAVFEAEMRHVFEATWVFLGFASQVPKPHDFMTGWIGRQPVVVMRDGDGGLGAFMNTCRHRGATVCHKRQGNARFHVCQYPGWSYDSAGRNRSIKDLDQGEYPDGFTQQDHDLVRLPRFEQYRGFLFGSLEPAVPPLEQHLGDTRFFLDLVVDQGRDGVELVPGVSTYTYRGNWKLQMENGLDAYHLTSTHTSFMKIVERRNSGESTHQLKALDFSAYRERGGFTFEYGHAVLFTPNPRPEIRPIYPSIDEIRQRVGEERAKWMLTTRNLVLFPNLQVAENASLQLRVLRPLAPNLTEMTIYCLAPVGEPREARSFRLRQFEDFFNSTGLATSDDTACYEDCQKGHEASIVHWQQGFSRGMKSVSSGPNALASDLGLALVATSQLGDVKIQDETLFHSGYREWKRLIRAGASRPARDPASDSLHAGCA